MFPVWPREIAAGLRPDGETVRLLTDRDGPHVARRRVDGVDVIVVPAGEPQRLAVRAHVAHVGAAAAGDRPRGDDPTRREIDDRHAALPPRGAADAGRPAIRRIELGAIAARIEPVRADAGLDEPDLGEGLPVDHDDAPGHHVGHEEDRAVRRDANVLRHAAPGEREVAQDPASRPCRSSPDAPGTRT